MSEEAPAPPDGVGPAAQHVAVVVNPTSGKGAGRSVGLRVLELLREAGARVTDASADSVATARARAEAAIEAGADTLCVVGGDGMAHFGINLTAGRAVHLGIVAAGTGNDFARNLGLPVRDPDAAVRIVRHGHTRRVDAGRVAVAGGKRWFGGVLGAGFDAVVAARAERMRWPRGQLRYNLAILRELPFFRPIPYVVECDGERIQTRAMLVAVANTGSFGGGMRICPDADPTDGLFDVLILHDIPTLEFLRVFPTVYSGRHVGHPRVEIRRAARVRLEAVGVPSQADGEPFEPLPLEVENVPGALTVLAPQPSGGPR
ncbi:MAG: YegS/Rv2252/BmrU family lipid kinase [Intrasporangium sp.]|uniref:diacylglycerol/lipid kinase family protein n=1 Tax=Intrasporangium sp. TaxID=1925024 RepID=UPI0026489C2B|nr:YegS/Rv2252/BmrU family lipid kinase [Intrasporangium sp.]MDN5794696.1 YegS/Rv2252/BmrU family lipid kinase [Intrasporangium sp.]